MIFGRLDKREQHRNAHKTEKEEKSVKLAVGISRGRKKHFKAARFVEPLAKISCFGEKFLAQDNKTLAGEGTKAEKAKKQIGKR